MSGIRSFNNLIGEPVNKYRQDYKLLRHFSQRFFENVENENQLERYIEYYRWIDHSLGKLLAQITPASMHAHTGIHNVVESHVLERNKIHNQPPIVKETYTRDIESRTQSPATRAAWTRETPVNAAEYDNAFRPPNAENSNKDGRSQYEDPKGGI